MKLVQKIINTLLFSMAFYSISVYANDLDRDINPIASHFCKTKDGILVNEFKNTDQIKFHLQINRQDPSEGTLTIIENGQVMEELPVTCSWHVH